MRAGQAEIHAIHVIVYLGSFIDSAQHGERAPRNGLSAVRSEDWVVRTNNGLGRRMSQDWG